MCVISTSSSVEVVHIQGSLLSDFGAQIWPVHNAKKYVFSRLEIPNLTKLGGGCGGGGFSIFISYNTNTEHIVAYLQFHRIIEYNHTCFFLSLF